MLSPKGPRDSLGITVAGGVGSPHGDVPVFIATMDADGPAAKTQQLQVGSGDEHMPVCVCAYCGDYVCPLHYGDKSVIVITWFVTNCPGYKTISTHEG